ncbi:MAG: glycosyltransferase family 2 protein [Nostoc sp. NMS1]|uniref:hormogonium polysaccharide biosynthesis glycosyltransferase HpsE n=1 Tax=unclassified Nostoc TaxID=2593658 RepID=UPI0025F148C0|nr:MULTISPECIES: hormogonium polysaccharide biosynthesis glycosyltransferase HpsE [unclassified Nostoc]MBN3910030.1 glycosyltransferase family 2 protein [Nostoc sp. NMS1]MBN3992211.1 glycosyltransferase family 2 protein [Nostoc sp. NMS2]
MDKHALGSLDFTVSIPTYNGAKRLPKVLDLLLNQTGVENLNWEIIIIDNNSKDDTNKISEYYQKFSNQNFSVRYFLEKEQGIAFARMRAINEARGEFIAFIDDDNLPKNDWVLQSYLFGKEHPQAGAWSGQIHGDFEVKPPKDFARIQAFLAIREHGSQPYLFDADNLRLPPGAALVVRKQAWCESVPEQLVFKGRLTKLMVGGDDTEALLYLHKKGWEIWYNPAMHIDHQIPHWRLEKDYLLVIARGCGLCIFQLRLINAKNWQKPILLVKTILGNLHRVLHHLIKYRGQLESNLIALFEINFYLASMMSPFYSLRWKLDRIFKRTSIQND